MYLVCQPGAYHWALLDVDCNDGTVTVYDTLIYQKKNRKPNFEAVADTDLCRLARQAWEYAQAEVYRITGTSDEFDNKYVGKKEDPKLTVYIEVSLHNVLSVVCT